MGGILICCVGGRQYPALCVQACLDVSNKMRPLVVNGIQPRGLCAKKTWRRCELSFVTQCSAFLATVRGVFHLTEFATFERSPSLVSFVRNLALSSTCKPMPNVVS